MYQIQYTRDAVKALKAMPRNVSVQICGKIELLAQPRISKCDTELVAGPARSVQFDAAPLPAGAVGYRRNNACAGGANASGALERE